MIVNVQNAANLVDNTDAEDIQDNSFSFFDKCQYTGRWAVSTALET